MSGLGINLTPAGAIKATPPAVSLSQKLAAPGGASNIEAAVAKAQEAARIQKQIQERLKGIGGLSGLSAIKAQTQARLADAAAALKAQQAKAQQKVDLNCIFLLIQSVLSYSPSDRYNIGVCLI